MDKSANPHCRDTISTVQTVRNPTRQIAQFLLQISQKERKWRENLTFRRDLKDISTNHIVCTWIDLPHQAVLDASPAGAEGEEEEEEVAAAGSRHTVFGRALQAGSLRWSDAHLQRILASDSYGPSLTSNVGSDKPIFDPQGHPLWLGEPFPTACARVDTLRAHGYPRQALRLAGAVVNTLRLQRRQQLETYKQQKKGRHRYYHHVRGAVATQRVCGTPQGPTRKMELLSGALSRKESIQGTEGSQNHWQGCSIESQGGRCSGSRT